MDSEILGLIVKELNKNGVNLIKHDFSNIDTFSPENVDYFRPGELPQIFDFSEHDKVFEDKIADLEQRIRELIKEKDEYKRKCNDFGFENQDLKKVTKGYEDKIAELEKEVVNYKQAFDDKCADYGVTSELLGKYQQENESLKQRVIELENFSCQAEQEAESLVEKLKQRIAELENRKTENFDEAPDSITIDGYKCKIIKTESGLYISRDEIYSIIDKEKEPLKQQCKELEDRHQSDCIEINRLNTTIDVLIHKVEYLRRLAGLE